MFDFHYSNLLHFETSRRDQFLSGPSKNGPLTHLAFPNDHLRHCSGDSKYESHFYLDGGPGDWQGEPLKNFTFEEAREKT